jgi:glucosylceramidase
MLVGLLFVLATIAPAVLTQPAQAAGEQVNAWVTTADQSKLLQQQASVNFGADSGGSATTIDVDEQISYQVMDGFGASFTDSSAWLVYNRLSAAQRDTLMQRLFSPSAGIGLSMVRQPMGASDFTVNNADYTYDDTAPDLGDFSINHDRAYIIPVVQQAKAINPSLKLMGTPWSAPAWMKHSGSLFGGTLNPAYYGLYADYFVKYVQSYSAAGLPIYAITLQNEPHHETASYPSMRMEPTDQAGFVKNYLGPAFSRAGINTKIVIWDHNWDDPNYPITVLNDAAAASYIAGTAFHCYAGSAGAQTQVHDAHPGKDLWFTECSGGAWSPDFGSNLKWNMQNIMIGATRNWAKSVTLWNMALDPNGGPTNGGCANCRGVVTINPSTGTVSYNVEYYVLGHASKFVTPGARRISSTSFSGGIETVAFKNPDGSKALIALNAATAARTFKVRWAGQVFSYSLPAGAVATFTWSGSGAGGINSNAYYKVLAKHSGKALDVVNASTGNGALIQQWDFTGTGGNNQKWRFVGVGGGYYQIIAKHSGKVLDVRDVSTSNGALIHQWEYVGGANQQWSVVDVGGGYYKITARHSGKALDVRDVSTSNGALIHQWEYEGGANQQWSLVQVETIP